ncbi:MAG: hypothetical protein Q9202_004414 [Teloschistes flavicans]
MKKSYADYLLDKENNKGREFSQEDVDNGWSVVQHNDVELEGWWDQAFSDKITPGQTHDHLQDPGQFIGIIQNKAFRSDQGGLVRDFQNKAHYDAWYVPAASGIVVTDSRSPEYELQKQYNGQLSTESISRSVPPLHRLSDSIWTIWSGITGQNSRGLRYIGRGNIINPDTISIMKALFDANGRTTRVPWPGITAGIDSIIGKVLLGTPNGIATGWLIVDHHSILGRREPTVTIWTYSTDDPSMTPHEDDDLDNIYMMLWDLGPSLPY